MQQAPARRKAIAETSFGAVARASTLEHLTASRAF